MSQTEFLPPWDSEDTKLLQQFLQHTRTGRRLIQRVMARAPQLLDGEHVEKTLVRNGEFRGFQAAIRELIILQAGEPAPEVPVDPHDDAYPSLTDDKKWDDGMKSDPPNPEPSE